VNGAFRAMCAVAATATDAVATVGPLPFELMGLRLSDLHLPPGPCTTDGEHIVAWSDEEAASVGREVMLLAQGAGVASSRRLEARAAAGSARGERAA
jgi:hypothetical protein